MHKDYGYRTIWGELRNRNIFVNKKKVQRIAQKLNVQVTSFTHKTRKYSSYKGKVRICLVERGDEVFIPNGDFVLLGGARISVASKADVAAKFFIISIP